MLKLDTHMDNWLMYSVYQNQGQGLHLLIGFTILPLMKNFCHTFLKNCKGYKVETWYKHGQYIVYTGIKAQSP